MTEEFGNFNWHTVLTDAITFHASFTLTVYTIESVCDVTCHVAPGCHVAFGLCLTHSNRIARLMDLIIVE